MVLIMEHVVELCRKNDRVISLKIIHGNEILNVISAYAPQVGIEE